MDDDLCAAITGLPPSLRDHAAPGPRLVPARPRRDRRAAAALRDSAGDVAAEIVDMLRLHPEGRRKVVRILAEVDAADA